MSYDKEWFFVTHSFRDKEQLFLTKYVYDKK